MAIPHAAVTVGLALTAVVAAGLALAATCGVWPARSGTRGRTAEGGGCAVTLTLALLPAGLLLLGARSVLVFLTAAAAAIASCCPVAGGRVQQTLFGTLSPTRLLAGTVLPVRRGN